MRKWSEQAFSVPPLAFMAPMQFWAERFLAKRRPGRSRATAGSKSPNRMWAEWLSRDVEMGRDIASLIAGVMLHLR
jgi:hypothetical protein